MPHILTAGFDDLVPLIIIISVIIARIIKATRKEGPVTPLQRTPGEPPPHRAPASSPGDELRQFLEALGGMPPAQLGPAPPPVPVVRTVIRNSAVRPPRPPARPRPRPARVSVTAPPPQPQPTPVPRQRMWQPAPVVPRPMIVEACELGEARQALNRHLADSKSLRGAWILREVLGPPVALRN